jgi:mannosyltransferase OCH1-like enzyme
MRAHLKIFALFLFASLTAVSFEDVDFDHSNGLDLLKKYSAKYLAPESDEQLELLRNNYEQLKPSKATSNSSTIIPKTLHLIWLGKAPLPKNYQYYLETWKYYHPTWKIKIWDKDAILAENFPSEDLFLLARSYAEQADIARYEIIHRYGGLYIDTDIECFSSFDDLHHKYDFYVNMEPPALNKKRVTIANNMIGAIPNHYILAETLKRIREHWQEKEDDFEQNFSHSWSKFARSNHNLAVQRTMYQLSDAVFDFLTTQDQSKYKSIILPSGYNIPMYVVNDRPIINFLSNSFRGRAKLSNKIEIRPETMSFHFYDKLNSLMQISNFADTIFDKHKIKGFFYKLLKFRDKYYLAFRNLFYHNFPTEVEYNSAPIINKIIYINSDKLSAQKIFSLEKQWKKYNPDFTVIFLKTNDLRKYLPQKLSNIDSIELKLLGRFCLLNQTGGVFVEPSFKPAKLDEFHHKYAFYGMFSNLNKIFDQLKMDTDIIAFTKEHTILYNLIKACEQEISEKGNISNATIRKLYLDHAYKYYQLDGKSVVLPEMFFNQKR